MRTLFAQIACASTGLPTVARFVEHQEGEWLLVGTSKQRPGTHLPAADGPDTRGAFVAAEDSGGCPRCGADRFARCGRCGALACWDTSWERFSCPGCGNAGPISGDITGLGSMAGT